MNRRTALGDYVACILTGSITLALGVISQSGKEPDGRWQLVMPILLVLGLFPFLRGRIAPNVKLIHYMLLAIPYAVCSREWPVTGGGALPSINFGYYAALYAQVLSAIQLYQSDAPRRYPLLIACALMGLGICGLELSYPVFSVFGSVALLGVFLLLRIQVGSALLPDTRKTGLHAILAAVVLLTAAATTTGGILINRYSYDMQRWMMQQWMISSAPGFSGTSRIGSINALRNSSEERQIAIRVYGAEATGYLRGRVYWFYENSEWQVPKNTENETAGDESLAPLYLMPGRPIPDIDLESPTMVYPAAAFRNFLFLPLSACALDFGGNAMTRHYGNTFTSWRFPSSRGYGVYVNKAPVRDPNSDQKSTEEFPALTETLTQALQRVCDSLPVRRGDRAETVVRAVRDYFVQNYTYHFGIRFENEEEPLAEFLDLSKHTQGHCELFASAGTLMLRHLGVKARYVTGFVVNERNPYGKMWVARQKDAHAWVEYADASGNWHTAEFTPPGGVPEAIDGENAEALEEYLRGLARRTWGFLMREGLSGLFSMGLQKLADSGRWLIAEWWRLAIIGVTIIVYLVVTMFRFRRKRKVRYDQRSFDELISLLRDEFNGREKSLRRKKLGKLPSETLLEYGRRLQVEEFAERDETLAVLDALVFLRYNQPVRLPDELHQGLPTSVMDLVYELDARAASLNAEDTQP